MGSGTLDYYEQPGADAIVESYLGIFDDEECPPDFEPNHLFIKSLVLGCSRSAYSGCSIKDASNANQVHVLGATSQGVYSSQVVALWVPYL